MEREIIINILTITNGDKFKTDLLMEEPILMSGGTILILTQEEGILLNGGNSKTINGEQIRTTLINGVQADPQLLLICKRIFLKLLTF